MVKTLSLKKNLIIFGIPLLLIASMILLAKSQLFLNQTNKLSFGITFDLLLTNPVVYFLLIRKTNIPKTSIVPFLILGMVVATQILPTQNQQYLNLFKTWVFPIVELVIVSFVIYKVRQAVKGYKSDQNPSTDFYTTLKNTCYDILPKGAVIPVVTEIAVFYYGFLHLKKRALKENEYSYHKESGTIGLLVAIIGVVAIETFVLHKLLLKWSNIAAWILAFLSVYSGFQLFGFLRSMYKRPITIVDDKLMLRYGIMNETTINIATIESIELTSKDLEFDKETRRFSILGELESHNVVIRLKEENTLTGLYGIKRKYKTLALHIDNNVEFKDQITSSIQNLNLKSLTK